MPSVDQPPLVCRGCAASSWIPLPQPQTVCPPPLWETLRDSLFQDQQTQEQLLPLSCHSDVTAVHVHTIHTVYILAYSLQN